MSTQVADLEAVLKLNDKEYKKSMQNAENQSKKTTDKISNDILSMGNIAKIAFAKLTYEGTQAFIGLGKAAINYTSDLKELENVLSVTFGDRFNAIALNADAMGRAMGRSSLQMRGAVAQAGALGKGIGFVGEDLEQMSLKLAQTAVDMGSFFNVADSEAWTALSAGLIGETEPMKRFGIVLTENNLKAYALAKGIKVLWKDMTEAEKTQIRYNYILEKTSFFAGDAERTIGSTANQTKVLKARLGDLYGVVGNNLEPVWNEFLKNLNDSVTEIMLNEEATRGLTDVFIAFGKVVGGVTWITKNFILGVQNISSAFSEVMSNFKKSYNVDDEYRKIITSNNDFIDKNKKFFDEIKKQRDEDLKNADTYNDKFRASYEYKLKVINKYNENMLEGVEKGLKEKLRLENLYSGGAGSENAVLKKPKAAQFLKEEDYSTVLGFMKSGKIDYTKLKGNQGIVNKTYKLNYEKQVENLVKFAKNNEDTVKFLSKITEIGGIKKVVGGTAQNVSVGTDLSNIKGTSGAVGTGGTGTTTEALTLEELKANYEAEKKSFEEYAKQRQLTEEEKNQQLLQINDSYAKQAIDNGWLEYASTLSANANKLQSTIEANEMQNKAIEDNKDLLIDMSEESKTYFEKIGDDFSKEMESYDKTSESLQAKIKAEKDYALQQQEIKDNIFKSLGSATTQDELKNSLEELYGKYSDNAEIIEYINSLYPGFLANLDKQKFTMSDLANVFSETSKIASELAILFEDDFLGAMASMLSAGSSLVTNIASGNVLGSISSGLSLVNQLDSLLNDSDISEKQEEAYAMFEEAVNEFKKAVEDFSIGEKINYAKLSSPSSLASVSTTSGGVNSGSTSIGNYTIASGASDATVDLTGLKNQLTNAGYTDLANQLGNIIGKYAQYSTYYKYGVDKESYISGYDMKGFYAELNTLIQEAWRTNMDKLKEAISLSSNDFVGNMIDVFKSGGEISTSVNDMFYNAVVQAFFNQEAFEALNANLGDAISQKIIEQMTTEGINLGIDFSGMSVSEMLTAYTEIYGSASEKLTAILEELGIAASSATDELNNVSTKNLPDGLKVATASYQATSANYGSTYQTIYQVENNYSKDFSEMVANAQNQSRFNQTGNARRGY